MLTNIDNADNDQENNSVEEENDHASQKDEEVEVDEEYIKLEMYENKYYTCDSDSEVFFSLADEPAETVFVVNLVVINNKVDSHGLAKEVHMCKVKVLAFKEALTCLALRALVTWVK
ncbi:hypothetical protein C0995_015293, partial [Termitomyces sp. Mi166